MSKLKVSLEEFSDLDCMVGDVEIRSHLALPEYVPTADAYVDLGRIATICRVGRLESINFKLADGESGGGSAQVSGINSDGSAVATRVRSEAVTRARAERSSQASGSSFPKGNAQIKINANHPDMDDKPLRDIEPWSNLIDKGIRQGLAKSVHAQLISLNPGGRWGEISGVAIGCGVGVPAGVPLSLSAASYVILGVTGLWYSKVLKDPDPEKKLVFGFPLDRYAAARGILATTKIVKPV